MAVAQPDHIRVVAIRRTQGQDTEIVHAVRGGSMMFFEQLVPEKTKRIFHHVHHRMMWDRNMARGRLRDWQGAKGVVGNRLPARVEHQGHGVLLEQ